jgi:hypothetical protein
VEVGAFLLKHDVALSKYNSERAETPLIAESHSGEPEIEWRPTASFDSAYTARKKPSSNKEKSIA